MAVVISGANGIIFPAGGSANPSSNVVDISSTQTLSNKTVNAISITTTTLYTSNLAATSSLGLSYANTMMAMQPIYSIPPGKTKVTFSCTGANQSWTVPAGVTSILVKLWGAGGGGGSGYIAPSAYFGMTFAGNEFNPALYEDNDLPKTYDGYNNWAYYAVGGDAVQQSAQYTSAGGGSGFCVIYY